MDLPLRNLDKWRNDCDAVVALASAALEGSADLSATASALVRMQMNYDFPRYPDFDTFFLLLDGDIAWTPERAWAKAREAAGRLIARYGNHGMNCEETTTLYRPTGPRELELVQESGSRRWPPRLIGQPIFYPVTNEKYAIEIATRWNIPESAVGYVTRFQVRSPFMERYDIQKVGGAHHTEWWVPAEELETLNDYIVGTIEVIGEYRRPSLT